MNGDCLQDLIRRGGRVEVGTTGLYVDESGVSILDATDWPERLIEKAGRTCYRTECKGDPGAFVRMLIERGHESVLEHAKATLRFVVDRGVSHELVRHRLASFSQESTRFCNYSQDRLGGITVIPMLDGLTDAQLDARIALYEHAQKVYLDEVAAGIKPQQARDNLPTCLRTEVVMTANAREWRLVMNQRMAPAAHPAMRKAMFEACALLKGWAPNVFHGANFQGTRL